MSAAPAIPVARERVPRARAPYENWRPPVISLFLLVPVGADGLLLADMTGRGDLVVPAGSVEDGETPEQAAQRVLFGAPRDLRVLRRVAVDQVQMRRRKVITHIVAALPLTQDDVADLAYCDRLPLQGGRLRQWRGIRDREAPGDRRARGAWRLSRGGHRRLVPARHSPPRSPAGHCDLPGTTGLTPRSPRGGTHASAGSWRPHRPGRSGRSRRTRVRTPFPEIAPLRATDPTPRPVEQTTSAHREGNSTWQGRESEVPPWVRRSRRWPWRR